MAGHRNRLEENVIENNGRAKDTAGIRVRGETHDLVFKNNIIRETRTAGQGRQTIGIQMEENVGTVTLEGNNVEAPITIEDKRRQP
jgi:hypothetical protein